MSTDEQSRPLRAAARYGALGLVGVAALGTAVGGAVAGAPGVWGAVLGAAVGGGFILFTVGVVLATAGARPTTTTAVLMGTWLIKLVGLLAVLALLRRFEFYDRTTFGVVVLCTVVGVLGLETAAVLRTRSLYVHPNNQG